MNFNVDFNEVRSILNYSNENIVRLQRIEICGGNEEFINEIQTRLKNFLTNKNYLDFDGQADPKYAHQLRRITFYLMLNTGDIHFQHDLANDVGIVHVLQDTAQLSKCLLLSLVWSLSLGKHFSEAIAYTPHWFAWPFFDQAVETLKQLAPLDVPSIVEELFVGIYQNIARSDQRCLDDAERSQHLKHYHDFALELLQTFMIVDLDKYQIWRAMKKSRYLGQMINNLLCMVLRCAKMFQTKASAFQKHEAELVYSCLGDIGTKSEGRPVYGELVYDTLNKLNVLVLNYLQSNFLLVKVNNYIDWSDIDISEELTLQRQVAEAAYRVSELIKSDLRFAHDVCQQLDTMSSKPQTLQNVIENSNMGEIMGKLDSLSLEPEIREMWLNEFLSRGILVFDNIECLETLEGNIEHMKPQHVQQMIRGLFEHSDRIEDASADKLRDCIHRTSLNMNVDQLLDLIKLSLSLKPLGVDLEHSSFSITCIQLFNRFTSADISSTQPLQLLLQNPTRFFEQLISASIKSEQQQSIVVDFIVSLPSQVSQSFVQHSLASYANQCSTLPADEIKRLSTLIVRLHTTQYESKSSFFKHFYKMISNAAQLQDLPAVICLTESLQTIMKSTSRTTPLETSLSAPLLVMCATIADFYRWDMLSFSEQRVHLVELLLDVIQELRKRFLPVATEAEKTFVLQRIAHLKPITRIYFRKLQDSANETTNQLEQGHPAEFVRFLLGAEDMSQDLTQLPQPDLLGKLISVIIRCTPKECVLIANFELVRTHWFSVIALLNRIVARPPQTANNVECLRYSCRNLANVIRTVFNPIATTPMDKWALLIQYVKIVKDFEKNDIYEYLFMDAHYVMTEILQELQQHQTNTDPVPVNEDGMHEESDSGTRADDVQLGARLEMFKQAVLLLRDCEARQLLLQHL